MQPPGTDVDDTEVKAGSRLRPVFALVRNGLGMALLSDCSSSSGCHHRFFHAMTPARTKKRTPAPKSGGRTTPLTTRATTKARANYFLVAHSAYHISATGLNELAILQSLLELAASAVLSITVIASVSIATVGLLGVLGMGYLELSTGEPSAAFTSIDFRLHIPSHSRLPP
ncbi:hypothetical protein Slin15195_G130520 [Septoria linicola]|uniref:Uncharacterized protein n=1 Tax=Septoria linicola TaxID=215465 RepID=A0A9Q9ESL8_9PEZI|nr:hypothetical protein Slin14017_G122360 [Septoria linicola]USW59733.1 hypothetical protein Slin15195_G130520 [Septoria linicola]